MSGIKYRVLAGSLFALATATIAPQAIEAGEGDYIGLFAGLWSGTGMVLNDAKPWQVNCQAVGQPGINHLIITGSCHVFVVSVDITADVTYDPKSGRYSGTYTGGDMAARISGKRSGDTVDFTMTWARPINNDGDTHARMTIVNSGRGNLRIMIDNLKSKGPEERSSDLLLTQS
jgi:hypothetical protein